MGRGDIYIVDLDPPEGREANQRRPAVLVSNDGANRSAFGRRDGMLTIVPITSNVSRVFPFQVLLPAADTGLRVDSKAQAEQVRSVDVRRFGRRIGRVPPAALDCLDDALRLHLAL